MLAKNILTVFLLMIASTANATYVNVIKVECIPELEYFRLSTAHNVHSDYLQKFNPKKLWELHGLLAFSGEEEIFTKTCKHNSGEVKVDLQRNSDSRSCVGYYNSNLRLWHDDKLIYEGELEDLCQHGSFINFIEISDGRLTVSGSELMGNDSRCRKPEIQVLYWLDDTSSYVDLPLNLKKVSKFIYSELLQNDKDCNFKKVGGVND